MKDSFVLGVLSRNDEVMIKAEKRGRVYQIRNCRCHKEQFAGFFLASGYIYIYILIFIRLFFIFSFESHKKIKSNQCAVPVRIWLQAQCVCVCDWNRWKRRR